MEPPPQDDPQNQTKNPLLAITSKQKKRLARLGRSKEPASPTLSSPASLPSPSVSLVKDFSVSSPPISSLSSGPPSTSTVSFEGTPATRKLARRVASERRREVPELGLRADPSPSSSSPGSLSNPASLASTSSTLPVKLNKASSWMTRLAHTSGDSRRSGDAAPASPRLPHGETVGSSSTQQTSADASLHSSSLEETTPPSYEEGADEEDEKRKKRFFNNLIFFKDVENTKGGAPITVVGYTPTPGVDPADPAEATSTGSDSHSVQSSAASSAVRRDDSSKVNGAPKKSGGSVGAIDVTTKELRHRVIHSASSLEEGDARPRDAGSASGTAGRDRADRLRKVASGRGLSDTFLKAARINPTVSANSGGHAVTTTKSASKKKRSDVIEELVGAEKAYISKLSLILRVKWFFGRIMLAIHDEVHMRPSLEKVLGQFDSYLKQHADFLAAITEKLRHSWDNSSSLIGDLLIDKACTPFRW